MTTETKRTFTSQLVAWCPDDQWWLPEEDIGRHCPGEDCRYKLVKRRMWVCDVEDCHQAYKKLEEAQNHDCFSAY